MICTRLKLFNCFHKMNGQLLNKQNFSFISKLQTSPKHLPSDFESRNILQNKERGLIVGIFPDKKDDFEKLMAKNAQTCYCGFDPTATSLHIGNLLALIMLIHCQRRGHRPIVVIGSATALIGDPSDKTSDRTSLSLTEIASNSSNIEANISKIFENHEKLIWKRSNSKDLPKLT